MTTPGVTCANCLGRIDQKAFDTQAKIAAKLGRPKRAPKLCSDCAFLAVLSFAFSPDEERKP